MQDMSINQGDSLYLSVIKYDDEGDEVAFDENDKIKFTARRKLNQKTYDIESDNARIVDGVAIIEIPPNKTNVRLGEYYYDIQFTTPNADVFTICKGMLTVEWDVTD